MNRERIPPAERDGADAAPLGTHEDTRHRRSRCRADMSSSHDTPSRAIVWPLAIAETITWATLYYSFPALLLEWERQLGWSRTELTGAFTLALAVSAVCSPLMGRVIDRGYGSHVFAGSALLGGLLLALLAGVTARWQFVVIWLLIGVARAGALYETCFAILSRTLGESARRAITVVALAAGFAGTLAFAGTHAMVTIAGWRGAVMAMAALTGLVAAPLIWHGSRRAETFARGRTKTVTAGHDPAVALQTMKQAAFWLLAVGFITIALDHGMLLTHLLPLLDERGISSETAVLAASMIGPMQVAGRLAMMAGENRLSTLGTFCAAFAGMIAAAACLLGAGRIPALLAGFVLLHGAGYGVVSILRPVAIAEYLGYRNFGLISGMLSMGFLAGIAAAPMLGSLLWSAGGYDRVIVVAMGLSAVGLVSLLGANRLASESGHRDGIG